ncbi:unnamed protein product [Cuscuta campestris]|uniref:CCHC-type domain-containing protein n=1 Tax=Cuscuta campestris TaxID=132261 RepID=A0A484M5F7_9ASTE|nr:unnamed protein product [Cuscuta campestris]
MRIYICSTNFQLWLVIKNSKETPMNKVSEKLVPKTEDEFNAEDIKKVENYAKAINMLYCAVNPNDYRKISCCTTAKEMWDKLEVTYEGTDQVREAKIDFLTQEYEMFRMKEGKKIDDMFDRFSKIINNLHALKKTYANKDLVRKILRSLTPEWRSKADVIYESIGVSNVTIDGLRGNLKTYESTILTPSLDEQKKNGKALKATKETMEEVSSDDDNEFGLVIKKFHKFMKKEFERKGRKHDGPPKCYCCGEIGHIKPRCPKAKHGKDKPGFKNGCSKHMTGDASKFLQIKPAKGGNVIFGDNSKGKIIGIGSVGKSENSSIDNVLLVKDSLERLHVEDDEEDTPLYTNLQPQPEETPQVMVENEDQADEEEHEKAQEQEETELPIAWRTNKNHPLDQTLYFTTLGPPLGITELIRHASGRPTIHSATPESRLLLYIVSRIIKPWKHGHTIMSGEDLKFLHAIMHTALINWAKFVMINMTVAASTDHDHLLPYPFVVMDILERIKVTTTVGPLTKATKLWMISTQTFTKRSDNAAPTTAAPRHTATAAGPAEPQAQANLASIADSLNRLHFKVDGMDGYLERLDEAVQCQGYAMNAYFQRVNYVPPPYHGTFFGQVYGDEDEDDDSYPSSSPDEDEFDDAIDGDEMDRAETRFFWAGNKDKAYHWKNWGLLCKPKEAGGLGISRLDLLQIAFNTKLWWELKFGDSLWKDFVLKRYPKGLQGRVYQAYSPIWKTLVTIDQRWSHLNDDEVQETGFQREMGVDEQILLVEEMVHKIDSKIRGGNVILKLHMAKAFDNMEWSYIQGVLNKLGFSDHNQKLLMANLKVHSLPASIVKTLHRMMSNFFWGYNLGKPKYHWKSWKDICLPNIEGGLGIRDLGDLQEAYSIKLWWNFKYSDSKWAIFMRNKYGNTNFEENITDSPTRKRICRIHLKAMEMLEEVIPTEDEMVKITIKHAYESRRPHSTIALSDKYNWNNMQVPKVKLFLWKINNDILPFPDNLTRMSSNLPSQCPFCKRNEGSANHCLLHCEAIKGIWDNYDHLIEGPSYRPHISINQHILEWHLRSESKTLKGNLKLVIPGVIAWSIWKHYASITFGNEVLNIKSIESNINQTINLWCWKNRQKGWMIYDFNLHQAGLQMFSLGGKNLKTPSDEKLDSIDGSP